MASSIFNVKLAKTRTPEIQSITLGEQKYTTVCPPPMLSDQPESTSPHHLFLASVGACVNLVFEIALEKARVEILGLTSEITGDYETDGETGISRFESIKVSTSVTVPVGTKEKKIRRLFDVAHRNCPIGNCLEGSCVKLITELSISYQ